MKFFCINTRSFVFRLSIGMLIMFASITHSHATLCQDIFTDGIATSSSTGTVDFDNFSRIENTDGVIDFRIGQLPSLNPNTCSNGNCVDSGNTTEALNVTSFQFSTSTSVQTVPQNSPPATITQGSHGYITVEQNSGLNINQPSGGPVWTLIRELDIQNDSVLNLTSGTYWIENLTMGGNARLDIDPGENVVLLVNNYITPSNVRLNSNGSPDQLFMVAFQPLTLSNNTQARAYLYTLDDLVLEDNVRFEGAINTQNLSVGQNVAIIFDEDSILNGDFGGLCDTVEQLPDPIGHWSFDMCSVNTGVGEVADVVGSNDADVFGTLGIQQQGQRCQALSFSGSNTHLDIPFVNQYNIDEGTISLWVKPNDIDFASESGATQMALVSKDANGFGSGGHMGIYLSSTGQITIRQQGTNITYTLTSGYQLTQGQWHHIAYAFGPNAMRLYIDGARRAVNSSYTEGIAASQIPITLGANASNVQTTDPNVRSSQLKEFFLGEIDDFRIYDVQLNENLIDELYRLPEDTCINCYQAPELVSNWDFDLCSVDTTSDAIVDIVGGNHGTAVNNVDKTDNGRFCQGLTFDGQQSYVKVPHANNMELSNGALSMWFKVDDLSHASFPRNDGNALFSKDNQGFGNGGHLTMRVLANGALRIRHQSASSDKFIETSGNLISAGNWHHLTYSFGTQGIQLFVDGNLVASDNSFTTGINNNQEFIVFGASARTNINNQVQTENLYDFLQGDLDQIKLYRNQPNQSDVSDWYNESEYACTNCDQVLVASFDFSDTSDDSTTTIDSSGNGYSASFSGTGVSLLPDNNVSCRAMSVGSTNTLSPSEGLLTNLDVDANVGDQGTISMWYRANDSWIDNGPSRTIFDASTTPAEGGDNGDKYFYLNKRNNGRLYAGIEDSEDKDFTFFSTAQNFDSDTWVHIALTWDMPNSELKLFINGVEDSISEINELGGTGLGGLGPLVFGDNSSTYQVGQMSKATLDGQLDEIRIYNYPQSASEIQADIDAVAPCQQVLHYLVSHPDTALTCTNPEVTIKACTNVECTETYAGPSSLTLLPNRVEGGNVLNFANMTTVSLNNRDEGQVTLSISNSLPNAPVVCDPDCTIDYSHAGLEFFNRTTGGTTFESTRLTAQNPLVEVGLRSDGNGSGSCSALENATAQVTFEYQCVSTSAAPYTSNTCRVPFLGIPLGAGTTHSGTIDLAFDSNGEASLGAYNYADAGQLQLNATTSANGATVQATQTVLEIVPDRFNLAVIESDPIIAADNISINIQALGSAGANLPSYQPSDFSFSFERLAPLDANASEARININDSIFVNSSNDDSFKNVSGMVFSNGVFASSNTRISDVGTYQLKAKDADYLGYEIESNLHVFNRVIPAYFDVQLASTPSFADTCSSQFTYIGQAFGYANNPRLTVTAYNALGQVTNNYSDNLWQLNPTQGQLSSSTSFVDQTAYSGAINVLNTGDAPLVTAQTNYDGSASITLTGAQLAYQKVNTPSGADTSPFISDINLTLDDSLFVDADGVCYQTNYPSGGCESYSINNINGTEQRYGRLNLDNSFGPETHSLSVPIFSEYLVNGIWRKNDQDSCSNIAMSQSAGDIIFVHDTDSQADISVGISGVTSTGTLNLGRSDANDLRISPVVNAGNGVQGSAWLHVLPQSTANSWDAHLNYDWDGDGDIDNDDFPKALVTFGLFRGNDRMIHWREVFND